MKSIRQSIRPQGSMPVRSTRGAAVMSLAWVLMAAMAWQSGVSASETHVTCITHDIEGGDLTGVNGTYDIIFDGLCSIQTLPQGGGGINFLA